MTNATAKKIAWLKYVVEDNARKISIMISKSDQKENHISDHQRNATMLIRQKKFGAGVHYKENCSNFEKYLPRLKNGVDHDLAFGER